MHANSLPRFGISRDHGAIPPAPYFCIEFIPVGQTTRLPITTMRVTIVDSRAPPVTKPSSWTRLDRRITARPNTSGRACPFWRGAGGRSSVIPDAEAQVWRADGEQAGSGGFVEEDLVASDLSRRRITDEVQRRHPGRLGLGDVGRQVARGSAQSPRDLRSGRSV